MPRALVYRASLMLAMLTPFADLSSQKPAKADAERSAKALAQGLGGGKSMLATDEFLFVVHDGVLHQFDLKTLKLKNHAKLVGASETDKLETAGAAPKPKKPAVVPPPPPPPIPVPKAPSPAEVSKVVERALIWLKEHQDKDGRWDSDGFMKHDEGRDVCSGPGNAVYDVGLTGLSILALLTAGDDYKKEVRRGVSWLLKQQNQKGLIGSSVSHDFIYNHAVATFAVCKACQVLDRKDALMRPIAQKAINYLETHRNPYSVWRYQPRDNDNDTSVTSWCMLAYATGKDLGLKVNKQALQLGAMWFDQVTNPDGRAGYTKRGERSSRSPGEHAIRFPVDKGEAMTAASLLCRYQLGQSPSKVTTMTKSAELLLRTPPTWQPKGGTIDEYYWWFATHALQQAGGKQWQDWSKHLTAGVAKAQHQKGNRAGSWDPVGAWAENGGRIYTTAMLAMACNATLPAGGLKATR